MEINVEEAWVNYSEMDMAKYTWQLSFFSMLTSFVTHPFNVLTTRQQAGSAITGDKSKGKSNIFLELKQGATTLGFRGLFRGASIVAVIGLPANVVYFHATEVSREYLQKSIKQIYPESHSAIVDMVQASTSSMFANLVSNVLYVPAEVISNRMIVQGRNGLGTIAMTRKIYSENGLKGLYRGFNVSMFVGIAFSAQWWFTYSSLRREAFKIKRLQERPVLLDATVGLLAGVVTTVILHPLDTIKTRIMTDPSKANFSAMKKLKLIIQQEGVKSVWRGLRASMYQTMLSSTGFAIIYEIIKRNSIGMD